MKVFVLVRNIHDEENDTEYTISLHNSYNEAYEVMKKEYNKILKSSDSKDIYTYSIYSNCAYVCFRYYNINWEIHEKEIKED